MRYKYNDLLFYWQGDSDENILLEEYHSDGDDEKDREAEEEEEEEEEGAGSMKIFYCSRTHSQACARSFPAGVFLDDILLASRHWGGSIFDLMQIFDMS